MISITLWYGLFLLFTTITIIVTAEEQGIISKYLPLSSELYLPGVKHDESALISEELFQKLHLEQETWHLKPWLRTRTALVNGILVEQTCQVIERSFPDSAFDESQLRSGAVLLYVLLGIYGFTLLAIVCNDYFIPCVEFICEDLKIPQNVAAATFMAVATSCPEFFVNIISTFLTQTDMGIGTIIGSAIFNALGVASIGALAAITPIAIEMRPVTRDVIVYMINVGVLAAIVWDGRVYWYEAVTLAILYVFYFVVMFNSVRIFALYDRITGCCRKQSYDISTTEVTNVDFEKSPEEGNVKKALEDAGDVINVDDQSEKVDEKDKDDVEVPDSIWSFPKEKSIWSKIWWFYSWPLQFILSLVMPSPVTCRKFYPLTFIMCIVWIGANSYLVTWSMTIIGETFLIPDSIMGMTFLAFGGCLPEAVSIFIMSRRGEGGIGVSNALGANSLAILFALGLPWLIRTLILVSQGAEQTAVLITSNGLDIVVISLLGVVICLWLVLYLGKFILRKSVGVILGSLYIIFIVFAILVELEVIMDLDRVARC